MKEKPKLYISTSWCSIAHAPLIKPDCPESKALVSKLLKRKLDKSDLPILSEIGFDIVRNEKIREGVKERPKLYLNTSVCAGTQVPIISPDCVEAEALVLKLLKRKLDNLDLPILSEIGFDISIHGTTNTLSQSLKIDNIQHVLDKETGIINI